MAEKVPESPASAGVNVTPTSVDRSTDIGFGPIGLSKVALHEARDVNGPWVLRVDDDPVHKAEAHKRVANCQPGIGKISTPALGRDEPGRHR